MEEIIGLLVAVGAIIFKIVEKRLEKSGKSVTPPVVPEEDAGQPDFDFQGWVREALYDEDKAVMPEAMLPEPEVMKQEATPKPVAKPASRKKPVLMEETEERKGEKIDPKKLVIYSEIMKPKYTE